MGVGNSVEGLQKLEVVWKLCGNNMEIVWKFTGTKVGKMIKISVNFLMLTVLVTFGSQQLYVATTVNMNDTIE